MNLTVNNYKYSIHSNMNSNKNFYQQSFKAGIVQHDATNVANKAVIPAVLACLISVFDKITTKLQTYNDRYTLITMKDTDGTRRFRSKYAIKNIKQAYATDPSYTKELASIKDKKGNYRFNSKDIGLLIYTYLDYPDAVKGFVAIEDKDGNCRFDAKDICRLAYAYSNYSEAVKELAALINGNLYRFDSKDIDELAVTYSKYPDAVKELAAIEYNGNCRFNAKEIRKLADTYSKYPDAVKELAAMKNKDGKVRFDAEQINGLAEFCSKHPDASKNLLQ